MIFRLLSAFMMLAASSAAVAEGLKVHTVSVPAGKFIYGSDAEEREAAYTLDERAYGHSVTRKNQWYEVEPIRASTSLPGFEIMRTPVTNATYGLFIAATGHRAPDVDRATWKSYGLIHPFQRTRQFAWVDGKPQIGREQHPVVLVSRADAEAFAKWLSAQTGRQWSLPGERQWEKAARGTHGYRFPWGNEYDADRLNSHDKGPFTTMPVASFPAGASPSGMMDAAGQVYEWTATPANPGRSIVKGGSWDDKGCGVCRPAARHSRPDAIKHILVGFRLVVAQK